VKGRKVVKKKNLVDKEKEKKRMEMSMNGEPMSTNNRQGLK